MRKITMETLIAYNRAICEAEGAVSQIINENNLKSAISVQYSYFNSDEEIAAALFRSLIVGHGFQDGNKRVGVVCIMDILPPNISDIALGDITMKCAAGELTNVAEIAELLYEQ